MRRSPYVIARQLEETLCTYLETAYRISNQTVVDERARLLRQAGVVSQLPFVETTPRYQSGVWLKDLTHPAIPAELNDFARIGLPVGNYPLYLHQEQALRGAWNTDGTEPRNLIIASGTGSGKTEIFYLTILADILREAQAEWEAPKQSAADMGIWDGRRKSWFHRRRFETRPAAVRAIILYPMNALVNDQLRRLRQTLTSDTAVQWQQEHLRGNLVYFGRYTSQTMLPGATDDKGRRDKLTGYLSQLDQEWESSKGLPDLGYVARLNGPEMLARWNMQAAPPDILLTNYSMLEYMLVRPIEAAIFEQTRAWLAASKEHRLTLVLDEAHTYSGARGTEVAYLIRRLYQRLGIGPDQVRCIATSASLGETPEELARVQEFAAQLFDHPLERFSLVRASIVRASLPLPAPSSDELGAFARFQDALERDETDEDEARSVERLISDLGRPPEGRNHIQRLYNALQDHPRLVALRDLTARSARSLERVAEQVWGDAGTMEVRQRATAGLLAAGALGRSDGESRSNIPPILPSRLHMMLRGLPGLWTCLDPHCSAVDTPSADRPCGKLYTEPRIWCDCGKRVVELLSCRVCGLLIGGGVPESGSDEQRVWPYEDDLEGGAQYERYAIFALEDPGPTRSGAKGWAKRVRSVTTTGKANEKDVHARLVWEPEVEDNALPIEAQCPRCGQRRSGASGRNAIEPLRTTGAQSFAALVEHAFRLQPPRVEAAIADVVDEAHASDDEFDWFVTAAASRAAMPPKQNPNLGRKALTFSDSRQGAARLAGDLVFSHYRDLFRQLLLAQLRARRAEQPLAVSSLIKGVYEDAIKRGIDPTFGEVENYWARLGTDPADASRKAESVLDAFLRREMADRQVGVEALGLARWVICDLPEDKVPALTPFTREETVGLLYAVVRILAGENVIVPRSLDAEDWFSRELVLPFYRRVISPTATKDDPIFVWDAKRDNRLTRYLKAVLAAGGRPESELAELMEQLWKRYLLKLANILTGRRAGFGIPITLFALAEMPEEVYQCRSCRYLSAEVVNGVCLRCHQECERVARDVVIAQQNNTYRRLAGFVEDETMPDPFPLRVYEHTAQISQEEAAKRERRFQDQFLPDVESAVAHGVDILSVTTTMEMGIDIGDLTVVGLHNTPPTVANYQQRAGRAGRRSDGVAQVLTFTRFRSHDQYYYERMAEIITGQVRIPRLHLNNQVIAQRHVNAYVLQAFFAALSFGGSATTLFDAFGTVEGLLDEDGKRLGQLRAFVEGKSDVTSLSVEALRSNALRILSGSELWDEVNGWIAELPDAVEQVARGASGQGTLLNLLIERGLLPRYAFPVDVVALWLDMPSRWNQGEEIQRDLAIALSEYAPGAEVIVDGKVHESVGLYSPFTDNPSYRPSGWYYECPVCRYVQYASDAQRPGWERCTMCQSPVGSSLHFQVMPAIQPSGFRTDWANQNDRARKYRGDGQEKAGFASPAQLVAGESADKGGEGFDGRLYTLQRTGDLYVVNRGPKAEPHEPPGFHICGNCGRVLDGPNTPHRDPSSGRSCQRGRAVRSVLLHRFVSDIVLLGVVLPPGHIANPKTKSGRGLWLSLGTALRQGAAAHLQVDPEELAMGIRPWTQPGRVELSAEIFLYDTLPNGAGYARELAAEFDGVLTRAWTIVNDCAGDCTTACYHCLYDYGNQREHPLLGRHLAADVLRYLQNGATPAPFPPAKSSKALLERMRDFVVESELEVVQDDATGAWLGRIRGSRTIGLVPTHSLRSRDTSLADQVKSVWPVLVSEFDLVRRPFWVWNQIAPIVGGQVDLKVLEG